MKIDDPMKNIFSHDVNIKWPKVRRGKCTSIMHFHLQKVPFIFLLSEADP